jgi:xylulokinase
MINTIKAVMAKSGVKKEDVKGIGISGQMHGLVMLDKDNNVLRKSIIWCDQRTAAEVEEMNRIVGRDKLVEITANPALTGWTAAKILWVKNNEPEIYSKVAHILLPKDYLRFVLTHEYATEVSDASGMQLLDVPNRKWSDELLSAFEIDKNWLGKVYESCEVTGTLTKAMADELGLCEGTIVVAVQGIMQVRLLVQALLRTARHLLQSAHRELFLHTLLTLPLTSLAEFIPAVRQFPTHGTLWV